MTNNMDVLAKNGIMGQVISVGKGIAPESDIAVFNMLGYKFQHSDYVGRGVIEAIGIGIDFKDGDLALRGNFATLDDEGKIIDRRAGRRIEREDVEKISKEIEKEVKFSNPNTTVAVAPTVGHRVTVRLRNSKPLSSEISNTDPAYARVDGMGIAKAVSDFMKIEKCIPLEQTENAANAANLVNEFTKQSLEIMKKSDVNKQRSQKNKKLLNSILLRDAGNKYPNVKPINDLHSMNFSCIVDMPVEVGISNILKMKAFNAGGLTDYENISNYLPRKLKKIEIVDEHDNYATINVTIFLRTLIKKEFSQNIRIEKKSDNDLFVEILDGLAKGTRITISTIMQKGKTICHVNSNIKLSLKVVILYPIIKKEHNAFLSGVLRKISVDAKQARKEC